MERLLAPGLALLIALGQIGAAIFRIDTWPLTSYPMFAVPDSYPLKGYEFRIHYADGGESRIEEFSKVALEIYDYALLNSRMDIVEGFVAEQILYLKERGAIPAAAVSLSLIQTELDARNGKGRRDSVVYTTRLAP